MKKLAILVGVEKYQDRQITPLRFATADVLALADRLKARCAFNPVRVLVEQGGDGLPDWTTLSEALEEAARELRPEDLFLFFFSGHGVECNGHSYLLTRDCRQMFPERGLPMEHLRQWLERVEAGKRIILLDACRNDPHAGKGASSDNCMGEVMAKDIRAVAHAQTAGPAGPSVTSLLTACRPGQRAYEWDLKGHGVFTHYLLEGLDGPAWDGPALRFGRLAAYAQAEVTRWSQKPGIPAPQQPWFEQYGGAEEIVLAQGEERPQQPQRYMPREIIPEVEISLEEHRRRAEQRLKQKQEEEQRLKKEAEEAERRRKDAEFRRLKVTLAGQLEKETFEEAQKTAAAMLAMRKGDTETLATKKFIDERLADLKARQAKANPRPRPVSSGGGGFLKFLGWAFWISLLGLSLYQKYHPQPVPKLHFPSTQVAPLWKFPSLQSSPLSTTPLLPGVLAPTTRPLSLSDVPLGSHFAGRGLWQRTPVSVPPWASMREVMRDPGGAGTIYYVEGIPRAPSPYVLKANDGKTYSVTVTLDELGVAKDWKYR